MPPPSTKSRLDSHLVRLGLAASRRQAQAYIMAGRVLVNGQPVAKAGTLVPEAATVELKGLRQPFVSRGGLKLAHALDHFRLDPEGLVCLDVGASTGGFTDCLLLRGAARVICLDVGWGQLHWKLRNDPRVVVLEKTNARYLTEKHTGGPVDAAVIDVSFISLTLVLPPVTALLRPGGWLIALVKPQFEVGKGLVGKAGVVRDPSQRQAAVEKISEHLDKLGLKVLGQTASPIKGPKGNQEYLIAARAPLGQADSI